MIAAARSHGAFGRSTARAAAVAVLRRATCEGEAEGREDGVQESETFFFETVQHFPRRSPTHDHDPCWCVPRARPGVGVPSRARRAPLSRGAPHPSLRSGLLPSLCSGLLTSRRRLVSASAGKLPKLGVGMLREVKGRRESLPHRHTGRVLRSAHLVRTARSPRAPHSITDGVGGGSRRLDQHFIARSRTPPALP